ncbi:putative histidine kinase hhk6p [Diplodia seriata]|uniref:Putative histidine kinase hhk6p n=1 Tax=Diplodia seriata TaxID=420778 RepID=A0A0G2ETG7_9PEZI|nr:putative histidine kinase hhk6p [Diplodia seriata]
MHRSAPPLHLAAGASNGQPIRDAAEPQYAAQKTQMPLPVNDLSEPASYFDLHDRDPPSPGSARSEQLSIIMPPTPTTTAMALATLQYLPVPVLVLSSLKTVVLANEAMGRLLEVDRPAGDEKDRDDVHTVTDTLHGQTMLDLGIEMLQDGSPIRISWEDFLDSVWKQAQGEAEGNVGGPSEMVDESDQMVFKDVTEYTKRIAEQIEENEKQFEYITNLIPIMVWTTKPNGDHDWFSKRWYDYTGLTEEESLGKGWKLPFHEDDMPETSKRWQHSLKTGEEYNTEYRCRRYDGQWRWMLGRAVPFRDDLGKVIKWFGTCTDIHELVELRETAKQMRAQLLRVLEHARVTLWAVNRDRKIVLLEGSLLNDSFSHVTREKIGTDMYDLFSRDEAGRKTISELEGSVDRILDGKDSTEVVEMQFDGNNRWYRTRIAPLMVTSRQAGIEKESYIDGVYGVSMDITELRKRREELQAREEENSKLIANAVAAKEASRMKSQFLANMSHEIRTPIAGVIGMSELLLDTKLDQEQKDCAENIQRSANGLLTVINDILDLSKVESGRLDVEEVQFSLLVVLRDVNKMMAFAALRKNISYESNIPPEIERDLKVMGDPGRLRQILTNLLTNSIKFTSEGHVSLSVSINSENDETINVHFVVEDTGIGIEEEVRQRLFKPFSQADSSTARRFGGTGLGLAISKNLVDLMHGNIDLQSTLGQGTRASFSIPFNKAQYQDEGSPLIDLASIPDRLQSDISVSCGSSEDYGTPPLTPVVPNSGKSPLRHGRAQSIVSLPGNGNFHHALPDHLFSLAETERKNVHVLVVEDNQVNQQIALKTIRKQGFAVDAVWNGKEALEYLVDAKDGKRDRPDIILMDVQMPIMDGYKATHTIRTQAPFKDTPSIRNIPIVAMTASAIQGDKEKCQKAGMDDYLSKPCYA